MIRASSSYPKPIELKSIRQDRGDPHRGIDGLPFKAFPSVGVFHGPGEVNDGKEKENESLHE
jgi:hypothetical protein